jgi:hypothetical protein
MRSVLLVFYIYIFTNTQGDTAHSVAPSKCWHSSTQKVHMDMTGTGKQNSKAGTLQQPMLICGHTHASPEPCPTLQAFPNMHGT